MTSELSVDREGLDVAIGIRMLCLTEIMIFAESSYYRCGF